MSYIPQPGTLPARVITHLQSLAPGAQLSTAELCDELDRDTNGFTTSMETALRAGLLKTSKRDGSRVLYWSLGDGVERPEPAEDDAEEPEPPRPVLTSAWKLPPRSVFDLASASSQEAKPEVEEQAQPAPVPRPANALGWTPAPPVAAPLDPVGDEELADALAASSAGVPGTGGAAPMAHATVEQAEPAGDAPMFQAEPEEIVIPVLLADLRPVKPGPPSFGASTDEEADEPFVCALWSDGKLQLQRGDQELALLSVDETRALLHYLDRVCAAEGVS